MNTSFFTINATTMVPALTLSNATLPFAAADFHAFVSTVLSFTATQDWLKLFVVGSLLEMLRRYLSSFWTAIMRTFWITANFDSHTEVYRECRCLCSVVDMLISFQNGFSSGCHASQCGRTHGTSMCRL